MIITRRALAAPVLTLTLMGGSTTLLTGCPEDTCPTTYDENPNTDCEDDDEDGYCAVCCVPNNADGSICLEDCDDTDPWTHPGASDLHVDGIDADCNGVDGPVNDPPLQEICNNGLDDDGNGLTDCQESVCASSCIPAHERACNEAATIVEGTYTLSFANAIDALSSCGAAEIVLRFDATVPGFLNLLPSQSHYISSLTSCTAGHQSCNLVEAGALHSVAVEPGTTYIVIESGGSTAPFDLVTSFAPYLCGDGIVTEDEQCDDGNTLLGDGCDANCEVEYFHTTCVDAPALDEGVTVVDTVSMGTNMVESSCGTTGEPEYLYVFAPPANGTLSVALENAGPAALYARNLCTVELYDLDCSLADEASPAVLHVPATLGTPLYIFVDGFDLAETGATLTTLFNAHD